MSTLNVKAGRNWTLLGEVTDKFTLTNRSDDLIEYVFTVENAPVVAFGHLLGGGQETRDSGKGFLYARAARESKAISCMTVLTLTAEVGGV